MEILPMPIPTPVLARIGVAMNIAILTIAVIDVVTLTWFILI